MVSQAKRPGWIALGIALIFHLLIMAVQSNHPGNPGFLRKWLLNALVPGEKIVDTGARSVRGVWDGYIWLIGLQDQIKKLETQNNELLMQVQQQKEEIQEARRLQTLLGLT